MRRVTLFVNGTSKNGKVVAVYGTLADLLSLASSKLGIRACSLYNSRGGLIDDMSLIRDDDVLYVSEGDPFVGEFGPLLFCHRIAKQEEYAVFPEGVLTDYACYVSDPLDAVRNLEQRSGAHTDWLTLNIGGRHFTTTRSTLVSKEPESMLAHMFKDKDVWGNKKDERGAYLIDRSPEYFEPILNYLRHGQLIVNDGINLLGVLEEARFFGIEQLAEQLEVAIKNSQPPEDHSPISRKEFVRFLLATPTKSELRCQGLNFSGADLSRLDLRYINFKMANLSRCNLTHANLCCSNLERADLSGANLDGANLQGVKMLCSNAEGASLKGCNFEDPSGLKANLEGANLKGVDMEGSQMTGINLRVATLKNAKLKNCNLRGATLAGTDLENCDLSGCDLQEANLRGSNVKGAIFEEMLTPLHMSQSVR
uniref:BTB/POZ domain-containing protein KCTD9 n=1 Tax=Scleropages formosus TaxID=113540 RepID=A0A8C9WUL5_SCLFO